MFVLMKFENAGLHFTKETIGSSQKKSFPSEKCPNYKFVDNKCVDIYETDGDDYSNPVPAHIVSNVLHVLCGKIPVPSKRDSNLVSDSRLDEIAANSSYIKYDIKPKLNEFGRPEISETMLTNKPCYNSHKKIKTLFNTVKGKHLVDGAYNWDMVERGLTYRYPVFRKILNEFLGRDVRIMTFESLVYEMSKYWDDKEKMENLRNVLHSENVQQNYWDLLTGTKPKSNTSCTSNIPVLNKNGISQVTRFSGKIVCEINDEEILSLLKENCGLAKILDGGVLYISKYEENSWEIPDFDEYEKVF